jgi:predicted anti-sigma-YlaC factor YlaD
MKCDEVRRAVTIWDDPLAVRFDRETEEHLAGCPQCRAFREEIAGAWRMLDAVPEIDPSAGFGTRVLAAVAATPAPARPAASRYRYWIAAAACIALLGVSVLLRMPTPRTDGRTESSAATDTQDNAFLEDLEESLDRSDTGYLPDYGGWGGIAPAESGPGPAEPKQPATGPPGKGVDRHEGA